MPQSIVMICPKEMSINTIKDNLPEIWESHVTFVSREAGQLQFHGPDMSWYVRIDEYEDTNAAADEYRTWDVVDDALRTSLAGGMAFFSVDFSDFQIAKSLIADILGDVRVDLSKMWIDNDYGNLIPARLFLEMIKDQHSDWRRVDFYCAPQKVDPR